MDLFVPGPAGALEATLWSPPKTIAPRAACVVCNPHPLFGGTKNSTVVFRTARGLQQAGLRVLRFNFRGVGKSEGVHDGRGGETEDLAAALAWMAREYPDLPRWAGGFSFGARTAAQRASVDPSIERVVLVALPVAAFDCSFIRDVAQPGLIVMASEDEYGTLSDLRRLYPDLNSRIELHEIEGAGHFFEGQSTELQRRVLEYAKGVLEGSHER